MTAILENVQPAIRRFLHGEVRPVFGPPLVELAGVGRRYVVGGLAVDALIDVDLVIRAGEFVVVLGPSGSGKTTLLNLAGGLDVPTAGRIRVAGLDLTGASRRALTSFRRETVSFVFQTFNLFPGLTALENVAFGADVAGRRAPQRIAAEQLERVGLGDRGHHFPRVLSGGEQQRVAIARALATDNPVLLADEPTGELDFRTGVRILELLRRQAGPGRAVVVVTHNREISRAADRVVELSSGRVVADGPPAGGTQPVERLHW
ncbi:MAG TPA: ABC transporter ATP-binding protein [Candidatus Limnocylindrales bacterium]|nr:ABC transporter ATP-binding protein [Candidatus Limnocylindrales bacterium]